MSEYLSKKAVLEWLQQEQRDEGWLDQTKHGFFWVEREIESGAFDADESKGTWKATAEVLGRENAQMNSEVQRLRAALVKVVNRLEWWVKKFGCADVPGILFSRVSANEAIREAREALSTTTEPTNAAKVERFECPCCGCEISIKPKTELLKGEETA